MPTDFRSEEDGGALPDSVKLTITAPPVAADVKDRMPLLYDVARQFMVHGANRVSTRRAPSVAV